MSTIPFANWTKGELARELQARIDTSQYTASARKVRNFIIQRYGGLSFRPGFRLVGEVDNVGADTKYFPFQYNMEQSYIIAMEDQRMRLLASGGFVIEQNIKITAITKAVAPLVTAAFHEYVVGDRIYFSGIVGMTELNGQSALVTAVPSASTFNININTSGYTTFVSSDGDIRSAPPVAPAPPAPLPPAPAPVPEPPPTTESGGNGATLDGLSGWSPTWGVHGTSLVVIP